MPERPITLWFKGVTPGGYEITLIAPDVDGSKLETAVKWLDGTLANLGIVGLRCSGAEHANGASLGAETKPCPIHNVPMTCHTKGTSKWFSHQLDDGSWCRGKAKG